MIHLRILVVFRFIFVQVLLSYLFGDHTRRSRNLLEEANLPPGFPTPQGHRKQVESLERRQTLTPITLPESSPAVIGHVIIDGGDG